MANNGKNIAILALNMMIDADPAQISKEALQIKQKVENRIGNIELAADNEKVIEAFTKISKYSEKFKNAGMDLTKIYSGIFEAFADPGKSMFDILQVIDDVQNKLETLSKLKSVDLSMMDGFNHKQIDAVLAKQEKVTQELKKQADLASDYKKQQDELIEVLQDIDKYETRKFSASSAFTKGGKYKEAISSERVSSLGKELGVDTSNKSVFQDVQEYSKLIHIFTVLNELKKEYEQNYSMNNKVPHLQVLKEEFSIYKKIEEVRSRIAKTLNVSSENVVVGLPESYKKPETRSALNKLDQYRKLEELYLKELFQNALVDLDSYIKSTHDENKAKEQKRIQEVESKFETKAAKTKGSAESGSSKGTGGVGGTLGNASDEVEVLNNEFEQIVQNRGDEKALDLWTESAKALKDEFGDLVKYAVSAEEALAEISRLMDKQNPLKGNTALSTEETVDLLNYIERLYQMESDEVDNLSKDAINFYSSKYNHPKFQKTLDPLGDMTRKQFAEIERLKVAQKEVQNLTQESANAQIEFEEHVGDVERKMASGAESPAKNYEELSGVLQKLSDKFESISDISFLNSSSEELKQLFSSITSKFGEDLTEAVKNFKESLRNEDYGKLFDSIRENFILVVQEFQNSLDNLKWKTESKDSIDSEINAEINSIQLLKEKILEVRDAIDLKNDAFIKEETIVANSSKNERENLRLLEVKLLDIIEALEEMQKSSIKNIFKFEEGELVNLENVKEIARNWANNFLSEIQETLRNAEPVSVNVTSTPAKDSDSYSEIINDEIFIDDYKSNIKDVSVDINVEPKVESPTDFVSKIEEQIKDLSVNINVNPKIDNIDGLVDKQNPTVETEENNKKSNRKYKVVKAPVIKTKKHEEKEPVDDDIVVKKETEDLDLLEQKIKSVTTAVDNKTAAFEKERQIVSLSVQDELADLDKLKDKLDEILQSLQGLISSPINISIDSSSIFKIDEVEECVNKSIENLKNGMKDLPIEDLKKIGQAFKGLQLPDNIAKNIGALATALEGLKKTLDANASPEGIAFLNDIKELLAQSGKLKDLATVLNAGERKVKKAKEALSDDSKNKTPKSLQFNIEDLTEKELKSKISTAENAIANDSSTADAWKEKLPLMKNALENLVKQRKEQERIAEETRKANIEEARKELLGEDYSPDDNAVNRNAIKQKGLVGDPEGWTTTYRLGETQTQNVVYSFDEQGHLDTKELPIATNFEQLLKIIGTTEKEAYKLNLALEENRIKFGEAYDSRPLENAILSIETYLRLLDEELTKYGTRSEYEADYQKYLTERQRKTELLYNLILDQENKNKAKSTLALESKDQLELYGTLSKYTKEYIYWLNQEQSATGSARDVANALREELEKLMETLKADIHSYSLQDLEKELELDEKILEARRKLNYKDEVDASKKAKASYERQEKLETKKNQLEINKLGANVKTQAKNDVRIKAINDLIKKEEEYRESMGLTDKAEEARRRLIAKRVSLEGKLKTEKDAHNISAKSELSEKSKELDSLLSDAINKYANADESTISEANTLLEKLKLPFVYNKDVNTDNVKSIIKQIEKDTEEIIKALRKQHEKVEKEKNNTVYAGQLGEYQDLLNEAFAGTQYENAKFKSAKILDTSGKSTLTFLEIIGDKAKEITIYLDDANDAIDRINHGTFDWGSVKAKASDLRSVKESDFEKGTVEPDSDATKNRVQSQIEAYQKLIKSEEEYYKLQAKVETDFATDKEIARYKELGHLRDDYNNLIKESIVLTEEEQKFYNISGKKELDKLKQKYAQKQIDTEGMYNVYATDVFGDNLSAYISKNNKKREELSKGRFTNSYINELDIVKKKLETLNSLLPIDDVLDSDGLDKIKQLKFEIDSILNKSKDDSVKLATGTQVNALNADLQNLLQRNSGMLPDIKKKFKDLENDLSSFGENLPIERLNEFRATFQKLKAEMEKSGKVGNTFFEKIMDKVVYGWADIIARYLGLQDFIRYFQQIFENVRNYNTVLTEMRKVSDESIESLRNFQDVSFDIANSVGTTSIQLQKSTADFLRLGESLEQAAESAKAANILFNVSEFQSIDEATESLIAMSAAYKDIEKMDIVNKLNEIGNNFAISTDGLATALQKSASSLTTAGNDIDEAIALVTAGNAVVQDPDSVGAGLRTIALRITGTKEAKEELESLGEDTSDFTVQTASKLREQIRSFTKVESNNFKGFDILDANGNYKSTYEILLGISEIYEDILAADKEHGTNMANGLLETLAGKNRSNIAASILQSPDVLKEAYESSAFESEGSAQEELEKYLDSINGKIQKFQNEVQELLYNLVDSKTVKSFIDLGTKIVNIIGDITKEIKSLNLGVLPTIGFGFGAFLGIKDIGIKKDTVNSWLHGQRANKNKNPAQPFADAKNIIEQYNTALKNNTLTQTKWEEILAQSDDTLKAYLTSIKGSIASQESYIYSLLGNAKGYRNVNDAISQYNNLLNNSEEQKAFIAQLKTTNAGLANYLSNLNSSKASFAGYIASIVKTKAATILLTLATTALNAALTMGISLIAQSVLNLGNSMDKPTRSLKEVKEAADNYASSLKDLKKIQSDNAKTISDLESEYEKLSSGVGSHGENLRLTADEYDRYHTITNEIADIIPSLVQGFDDQNNAILNVKGSLADLNEEYRKHKQNEAIKLYNEKDSDGNLKRKDIFKTLSSQYNPTGIDIVDAFLPGDYDIYNKLEEISTMSHDEMIEKIFKPDIGNLFSGYWLLDTLKAFDASIVYTDGTPSIENFSEVIKSIKGKMSDLKPDNDSSLLQLGQLGMMYAEGLTEYNNLDKNQITYLNSVLNNLSNDLILRDTLYEEDNFEKFIRQLIENLQNQDVKDALSKLYEVDTETLAAKEVDTYIKTIANLLNIDSETLEDSFGFNYDEQIENVKRKLNQGDYDKIDELSLSDLKIAENVINSLTVDDAALSWDELLEKIKAYKLEMNKREPLSKSGMIDKINSMSDGFDVLDNIYADIVDKESFDFAKLDLSKFEENFKGLETEYNSFRETISDSPDDINACQEAFNELATAYIEQKGVLEGLTEENANVAISMLKNMGIANAEKIVMAQLKYQSELVSIEKKSLAEYDRELTNATYDQIIALMNETECSEISQQALAQLALSKISVNENKINTSDDIDQVIALANAAGASAIVLAKLEEAKAILSSKSDGSIGWLRRYEQAQKTIADIENGTFDYGVKFVNPNDFKVTGLDGYQPNYTGGDATKDAKDAASDAAEEFDFFERRVKKLEDAFNSLEQSIENVVGSFAKNKLVDAQLDILDQEFSDYTEAIDMYQSKANEFLSKIPEGMRDKVANGAISIESIADENLKEAINDYQTWADKVSECTQKLEELKTQLRELELQKFNNIVEDFTNQFDLFGSGKDLIDGQISLLEESGELIGRGYYDSQIDLTGKQLETLEAQKAAMVKQMADAIDSGRIQYGTAEWLEMVNAITEVDASILECKTDIEGFENAILELEWANFERLNTEFDNINDELSNLVTLLNDYTDIEVSDGEGNWTDKAITALGLYTQQYELAKHRVAEYSEQLEKLEDDYAAGKYSTTEYLEKLAELKQGQYDAVNAAEDMEDAIISLNETRINEEIETINEQIEAYKEVVDAQLEAIETSEKLADRQEDLADKAKSVADIEKKLAALQNDTTAAAIAERKQLEEELYNAKKELSDAEHDYSIEDQKDALNKQYENFEKEKQDEITALEESLKERERILNESFETVKANTDLIAQELLILAQEHGINVSTAITTAWTKGENSIASYGEALTAATSGFVANLDALELEIYNLQTKADETSYSLAEMFGQRADTLVQQLTDAYNSEHNLQNMTNALNDSLGGLASGFDGVASAAKDAADAISKVRDASSGSGEPSYTPDTKPRYSSGNPYKSAENHAKNTDKASPNALSLKGRYYIEDKINGEMIEKNLSKKEADDLLKNKYYNGRYKIKAYARGSKRIDEDQMAWTDEYGKREMIIRRSDGAILTRLEKGDAVANANLAENLFKWGAINPNSFMQNIGNMGTYKVVDVQPNDSQRNVVLNIAKMNEFNGDFNGTEQLLGMMNKVATNSTTKILNDINRSFRTSGR